MNVGGLSLGAGAQIRAGSQVRYGGAPAPSSAAEAAYGPVASSDGNDTGGSLLEVLHPGSETGLLFWRGVLATALLVLMYKSL